MKVDNIKKQIIITLTMTNNYVTSEYLSKHLKASTRTIKNKIREINEEKENGVTIVSYLSKGYKVKIDDNESYQRYINDYQEMDFDSNSDRCDSVLEYILFANRKIFIEELIENLFVSRTTINNCLKIVRDRCDYFGLEFISSNKGIEISGSEFHKRMCITYYRLLKNENKINDSKKVLEIFNKHGIDISYNAINRVMTYLNLVSERVNYAPKSYTNELAQENVAKVVLEIASLQDYVFLNNDYEKKALYELIYNLNICTNKNITNNKVIGNKDFEVVNKIIYHIYKTYAIDLSDNLDLLTKLTLHLYYMKRRASTYLWEYTPLCAEIIEKNIIGYMFAKLAVDIIEKEIQRRIPESEVAFITLFLGLMLQQAKKSEKIHVLLVCGSGNVVAQLFEETIKRRFNYKNLIIETTNVVKLEEYNNKKIDILISSVEIPFNLPIPIFYLQPYDLEYKWRVIEDYLVTKKVNDVRKYFSRKMFFSHLQVKNKEEIFDFLSKVVKERVECKESISQLLIARENIATTELSNLVAIPHPMEQIAKNTFVVILLLDKPIIWKRKKVQVIFSFLIKKNSKEKLENLYDLMYELISDKKAINTLIKEQTYECLLKIIKEKMRGEL